MVRLLTYSDSCRNILVPVHSICRRLSPASVLLLYVDFLTGVNYHNCTNSFIEKHKDM